MNGARPLPRISVVTQVLNGAATVERTIRSVLDQNYPDLEYVVADGGSTDGTVEIIRRFEGRLARWWSEPDRGPPHAINNAFATTTGGVMAWLGADDLYLPGTLDVVGEIFSRFTDVRWLTSCFPSFADAGGRFAKTIYRPGYHPERLRREEMPLIQSESTFWRRDLWEEAGGRFDESLPYACDFDLWLRFFERTDLVGVMRPLALAGIHPEQGHKRPEARIEWNLYRGARFRRPLVRVPFRRYRTRVVFFNAARFEWELGTTCV